MVRRRRFGLESPLPADPRVIERAILRHLSEQQPRILPLVVEAGSAFEENGSAQSLARGVPNLLLLLPGGRLACLKIKTQAQDLTRAQKAFRDLCRERAIPFHIVRSLPEARVVLDRLCEPQHREADHA